MQNLSFIPLGGIGDVTKNMYVYEYDNQILLVDCGIGFADETMLGVDLLLPDISYLKATKKKIIGMVLTHGHEDHIGALPYILPQLPVFPIFATPLTAALANEKLKEFGIDYRVQTVSFVNTKLPLGNFSVSFIRITHSIPDSSNLLIRTPIGNLYHASDFKFDLTPADGKRSDYLKIAKACEDGVLCLMSDCLGAEREGYTPSEQMVSENFEKEIRHCRGKFVVTTYSSNISRLNQAIQVGRKFGRKVCFIGRSLIKTKEVAKTLGYLDLRSGEEIIVEQLKKYNDKNILLLVAGSQGQANSAMTRIASGEHKDVSLSQDDVVIFSSDPIPGNETSVNALIDTISKRGAKVIYSQIADNFHVSGHGSSQDLMLMISLLSPRFLLPISGTYRHMIAYRLLGERLGYSSKNMFMLENGQEVIISKNGMKAGRRFDTRNVYVDNITGGEVESFVLRDRQKLSEGGIVILMIEINSATSQIIGSPDMIIRGFSTLDNKRLHVKLLKELKKVFGSKKGRVTNWLYIRNKISEISERLVYKELHRRPLVLPIVIEI